MPQYHAVFELSDIDGTNGFKIVDPVFRHFFGTWVAPLGDWNGDGALDIGITARGNGPGGKAYVMFGGEANIAALDAADGTADGHVGIDAIDGTLGFTANGQAAGDDLSFVAPAGDINGDGLADLLLTTDRWNVPDTTETTYVVFGTEDTVASPFDLADLDGGNGFRIEGVPKDTHALATTAGDLNGDGYSEIIIASSSTDSGGDLHSFAYVLFGHSAPFAHVDIASPPANAGFAIGGFAANEMIDYVASAGDVNGDGVGDVIICAKDTCVVFGSADGFDVNLAALDGTDGFKISARSTTGACAGDVNADGYDDIIFGVMSGSAFVVFGAADAFAATMSVVDLDGRNGFEIGNDFTAVEHYINYFAASVAGAGDVNGDGFADVALGDPGTDTNGMNAGTAYVIFGKASGFDARFGTSQIDGNNGFLVNGIYPMSEIGLLATGGDIDGDGFSDVMLGAQTEGAAFFVYGGEPAEAVDRIGTMIGNRIHGGDFGDRLIGKQGADSLFGHGASDTIVGGAGPDMLRGNGGDDALTGGRAADDMNGGGGADTFVYGRASESSGLAHDTIRHCDFTEDRIDAGMPVTGVDTAVGFGMLNSVQFDSDLAAAIGAAHLMAGHAVLFTPDAGDQAGWVFLIVDQNGWGGYQAGDDLVIRLVRAQHLDTLDVDNFI